MDKETIELIEAVRQSLVEFGKTQKGSALKKTRKITSQLIWSPQEYLDDLDNIKRTSKTDAEAIQRIRSLVRSSEEEALKTMTVLPDDTGHHLVQSRTGGDALTELPYSRSGPIIQRIEQKTGRTFGNTMGPTGNLPPEMSLSNFAHKADDRATGLERESGIGKNPDKTKVAHQGGTAKFANMKGVDLTSDAAIEAALTDKVQEQIRMGEVAAQTDAPRQEFLRQATGRLELYKGPVPKDLVIDPKIVKQSYLELINGSVKFAGKMAPGAIGLGLTALGAAGDALAAGSGGITAVKGKNRQEKTAGALEAASGLTGLAALTPGLAPALGPASLALGGVAMAADRRAKQIKRTERNIELQNNPQPVVPQDGSIPQIKPKEKSTIEKIKDDPMNELEYAGKQILGGLKNIGGAILFGY